jgi:acyl-CoA-binding protein
MSPVGFELTISADERLQIYGLYRATTETDQEKHNSAIMQIK